MRSRRLRRFAPDAVVDRQSDARLAQRGDVRLLQERAHEPRFLRGVNARRRHALGAAGVEIAGKQRGRAARWGGFGGKARGLRKFATLRDPRRKRGIGAEGAIAAELLQTRAGRPRLADDERREARLRQGLERIPQARRLETRSDFRARQSAVQRSDKLVAPALQTGGAFGHGAGGRAGRGARGVGGAAHELVEKAVVIRRAARREPVAFDAKKPREGGAAGINRGDAEIAGPRSRGRRGRRRRQGPRRKIRFPRFRPCPDR